MKQLKACFALTLGLTLFSSVLNLNCSREKLTCENFSFYAIDSLRIEGELCIPTSENEMPPLVILLHMFSHSREDWKELALLLKDKGYAVMNLDIRGHGKSTRKGEETVTYMNTDKVSLRLLALDVSMALDASKVYLGKIDLERVGIVGASLGANAGLIAASANPQIKTLVLISPGLNYHNLKTEDAASKLHDCSVFLIVSRGDSYSLSSCHRLHSLMNVKKKLELVSGREQGNKLLFEMPELNNYIVDWIEENLPARKVGQIE